MMGADSREMVDWLRQEIESRKAFATLAAREFSAIWTAEADSRLVASRWIIGDDMPATALEHIVLNDPRDVIARCDAELALLDEHPPATHRATWDREERICDRCRYDEGLDTFVYPCPTVLAVASAYRHRPGFKEDWNG